MEVLRNEKDLLPLINYLILTYIFLFVPDLKKAICARTGEA